MNRTTETPNRPNRPNPRTGTRPPDRNHSNQPPDPRTPNRTGPTAQPETRTPMYCLEKHEVAVDGKVSIYYTAYDGSLPVACPDAVHLMHVGFSLWQGEPDLDSAVVECSCKSLSHPDHNLRSKHGDCLPAMLLHRVVEQERDDWNFLHVIDQILIEMYRDKMQFLSYEPDDLIPEYMVRGEG